jgi:hypothetical protein
MRAMRSIVIISILVGSLLTAPAAFAAGKAPVGKGLSPLTGQQDITITNLVCDDETITDHLVARGGLVGWNVGDPDRMYVLTAVSGQGTVTSTSGSTPYSFEQSYGKKSGLGETLHCSMDYTTAYGDVVDTGTMEVDMVRVW